jgi:hypothetical protein
MEGVGLRLLSARPKPTISFFSSFQIFYSLHWAAAVVSSAFFRVALLPAALGLDCVREDAPFFLGALGLLTADEAGESRVTDVAAGAETVDASIDAIAVSIEPAAGAATSAVIVGTDIEEIAWTSSTTGASTIGDWVAVTSGMGAAVICESEVDDEEGEDTDMASMEETPDTKDCEATLCLGLTAYRTTATPAPVTRSMVSICSKTMLD